MIYFLSGLLLGVIIPLLIKFISSGAGRLYILKARLIKRYWLICAIFILISVIVYLSIFKRYTGDSLDHAISVVGQNITLLFAIVVGYFAFEQVSIQKAEQKQKTGYENLRQRKLGRAKSDLEDSLSLDPSNINTLLNLTELYLITADYKAFNEKVILLESMVIDRPEKVLLHYLKVIYALFTKGYDDAVREINICVKEEGSINIAERTIPRWGYGEIVLAEPFKRFNENEKKLVEIYFRYLQNALNTEEMVAYRNGDLLLQNVKPPEQHLPITENTTIKS